MKLNDLGGTPFGQYLIALNGGPWKEPLPNGVVGPFEHRQKIELMPTNRHHRTEQQWWRSRFPFFLVKIVGNYTKAIGGVLWPLLVAC